MSCVVIGNNSLWIHFDSKQKRLTPHSKQFEKGTGVSKHALQLQWLKTTEDTYVEATQEELLEQQTVEQA